MTVVSAPEVARLVGDWSNGGALYSGLAAALGRAISEGRLPAGVRLPAERALAKQLGVSRNTVVAAYERLRSRELVRTRQGSGTTVGGHGDRSPGPREARVARTLLPNGIFEGVFGRDTGVIDLRAAVWEGTDELPASAFDLDDDEMRRWVATHGYYPAGIPPLREIFADRLTAKGLPTSPEQIIVTSGAQQALALLVQYLIDPGDRAVVEDPTYPGMIETLLAAGAAVEGVPRTDRGLDLGALRAVLAKGIPRLVYVIATAHNPLGTTLPAADRGLLVRALRQAPIVVEDMTLADTELQPSGARPLATYADGEDGPTVITVGSLSKALWGGLRIGWLRAPTELVQRLTHVKAIQDIGTPVPSQVLAQRLLAHAGQIEGERRRNMATRLGALQRLLRERLPGWRWPEPGGGLSLWIDLGAVNALDFAAFATRHGVAVAPGTLSSPSSAYADHLRLPFGKPVPELEAAVERLAAAWSDYTRRLPSVDGVSVVL